MKTVRLAVASASLLMALSAPVQAFDLKGLTDSANKAIDDTSRKASETVNQASDKANSSMDSATGGMAVSGEAKTLVDSLSQDLGVSTTQAAGGAGALLAMAQSNLSPDQFSGILGKVPGLDSLLGGGGGEGGGALSSMLGKVSGMDGVKQAFGALGMSPDMIGQFAPKMLDFLGGKGVGGTALNALKGLWGGAA